MGGLDIKHAIALAWSPQGGIMQTFERPDREKGNQHKNLKVQLDKRLLLPILMFRLCPPGGLDHIERRSDASLPTVGTVEKT